MTEVVHPVVPMTAHVIAVAGATVEAHADGTIVMVTIVDGVVVITCVSPVIAIMANAEHFVQTQIAFP
jgi:hypothetical protein